MPVFREGKKVESVRDKMKAVKFTFPPKTDAETIIGRLIEHFTPGVLAVRIAEAVADAAPDIPAMAVRKAPAAKPDVVADKPAAPEEKPKRSAKAK